MNGGMAVRPITEENCGAPAYEGVDSEAIRGSARTHGPSRALSLERIGEAGLSVGCRRLLAPAGASANVRSMVPMS
jgi:hypothetical protein